ncbi:MAG: hypothetical protein ACREHC_07775 [Candidatus Levyibacteriota bacterium]
MINKLIRDKIPEIITANNQTAKIHIADDREYELKLNEKLQEETSEYLSSGNIEELADLMEVVYAILESKNIEKNSFEHIREEKAAKNGRFTKKLILESVIDTAKE